MLPRGWTIGAELELADAERDRPLPGRSTWDTKDYTIVNSNGVANDPLGRLWRFGGEVNTEPTDSVDAQVEVISRVLAACTPPPAANYRTNFHVHIRVPGLASDLAAVQRALRYTGRYGWLAFQLTDPLPPAPRAADWPDRAALQGARARWRRRQVSHHTELGPARLQEAMAAESVAAVRAAHAPKDRRGRPQYQLAPRCGVNFRALWETPAQTVEFRHFCMSLDLAALANALTWCVAFLTAALHEGSAPDQWRWLPAPPFPQQPLYDHWLETRYRATSRRYHAEADIRATLARWAEEGTLESIGDLHRQPLAQPALGPLFT